MRSLFFHASMIGQEDPDAEESQSEEEGFAMRRIHKESVHILSLIPEENVPNLVSPFAIYRNGSNVHVCQVRGGLKTKTISNIPGPTEIAVTESGTVFVSSSKERSLFSLKEGDLFRGTENIHKVSGGSVGHCDGIKSRQNMPASLFAYRQDANDQKMHDQSTSSPEEDKQFAQYANVFRIDAKAKKEDLSGAFEGHVKHVEEVITFLNHHEHKALERTGKQNTNGPDFAIPRATKQSFLIVLESLTSLANTLTEIGHELLLYRIFFESMTILIVERARCVQDDMLRICQKDFSYFTGPN
ncbi:unnamed protein product [Pocillopora meandrina]|uniref:Uncharacterized protein n=1 Tax=Pocillopora meandrina TaxID=46732 RepID=A0AAU9Y5B5_9CNID|nr:unnamed protein product [Pocillopora meandrina]